MGAAAAIPTDRVLAQVAHDMRACAVAFSDAATVHRATLQQTYTLNDLEARYRGYSRDEIVALLVLHGGYVQAAGKRVHLDHVLAVDAWLRRELAS